MKKILLLLLLFPFISKSQTMKIYPNGGCVMMIDGANTAKTCESYFRFQTVEANSTVSIITPNRVFSNYTYDRIKKQDGSNLAISFSDLLVKLGEIQATVAGSSNLGGQSVATDSLSQRKLVTISNSKFALTDGGGLVSVSVKNGDTPPIASDVALVVEERPKVATFGTNTPTVQLINTDNNVVLSDNCIRILIENHSSTANAVINYGGQNINIGYKGNTSGYSTFYSFEAVYDVSSKKYSPFASLTINASGSSIFVTKIFAQ